MEVPKNGMILAKFTITVAPNKTFAYKVKHSPKKRPPSTVKAKNSHSTTTLFYWRPKNRSCEKDA